MRKPSSARLGLLGNSSLECIHHFDDTIFQDVIHAVEQALSAMQSKCHRQCPGTFASNPPIGTILPLATGRFLTVTFMPSDLSDYTSVTATAKINVSN
jgi:hypothetical protein